MKTTIGFLAIFALTATLAVSFNSGIDKQEVLECKTWERQSEEYSNFYLLKWQKDQCAAHNININ